MEDLEPGISYKAERGMARVAGTGKENERGERWGWRGPVTGA